MASGLSYVHGASDVPLLGETDRRAFRRAPPRAGPTAPALVVREQGVRWTYAELRRAGRRLRRRPPGAGPRARRPGRHLVAQQRRVGGHPVRHRQGRADPGQHQPGLPHPRARVRAQQGRLPGAGHRHAASRPATISACCASSRPSSASAPGQLRAAGCRAATVIQIGGARARHHPVRRDRRPRHRRPARAPGRARRHAAVRRPDQHPVHQRHHRLAQGRDAHPPQHPQQRLLHRRGACSSGRTTGSASRCRSTTASAWCWATSPASPTARPWSIPAAASTRWPCCRPCTRSAAPPSTACRPCSSPSSAIPSSPRFDLSSLRTGIMAGSPCPIEVMRRVVDRDAHGRGHHRLRHDRDQPGQLPERAPTTRSSAASRPSAASTRISRSRSSTPRAASSRAGTPASCARAAIR